MLSKALAVRCLQCSEQALDWHNHQARLRIRHQGESKALVEGLCLIIDRVCREGAKADMPRGGRRPEQGVAQQPGSQAPPTMRDGNSQLTEQQQRYRVRRVAPQRPLKRAASHGGGAQRVIRDNMAILREHECTRVAGLLVPPSPRAEPGVEGRLTARKRRYIVLGGKRLRLRFR